MKITNLYISTFLKYTITFLVFIAITAQPIINQIKSDVNKIYKLVDSENGDESTDGNQEDTHEDKKIELEFPENLGYAFIHKTSLITKETQDTYSDHFSKVHYPPPEHI